MRNDPSHQGPADWLTVPGRLLLIVSLAGWGALLYFYVTGTVDDLPRGRYPIVLWVLPVTIAAFAFYMVVAFILEKCGVRIYRQKSNDPK